MSPGKLAAQVAHASMAAVTQFMNHVDTVDGKKYVGLEFDKYTDVYDWLFNGSFTKVVLGVDNEDEMKAVFQDVIHLNPVSIIDSGRTELSGFNLTCVGLPPMQASLVDPYTRYLKLY